ncbi:sodium-dependent phosphate transporter 2-like [Acanthaster planci]|uniref:Phosphate transporter n=1 Tax=Acanthaster planci TaxID=133434 RepID=A0A8B7XTH2_ACAPL|nr:sodium-dependent phosphate transporter 2-like [Acanthaster planci]
MDLPYVDRFLDPYDESLLWIVIVGFIIAFILAFGLGANDAANSFGTAVGAKVFTLLQAIILAAIFETLGSILLGGNVSGTIRGGLFNASVYEGHEELLMVGQLSALASACVWLLIATMMSLPVSASHSIVGASLGFHLVVFLGTGVDWFVIGKIAISWVASPVISGVVSSAIYYVLKFTMLDRHDQLKSGLRAVPFWYFLVFFVNILSILLGVKEVVEATVLGVWLVVLIALGGGLLCALITLAFLVPYTRRKAKGAELRQQHEQAEMGGDQTIKKIRQDFELEVSETQAYGNKCMTTDDENGNTNKRDSDDLDSSGNEAGGETNRRHCNSAISDDDIPHDSEIRGGRAESRMSRVSKVTSTADDEEEDKGIFSVNKNSKDWLSVKDTVAVTTICGPLQGLSACFAAFSHGGNDVSNAIGPLIGLYLIYQEGRISVDKPSPAWILVYGGVGIAVGLALLGRRVIKTIGSDLTPITPSTGFAINLGAAMTVLIASNLSIPVSTTHCLVGSVAFVGFLRARKAMDLKLFTGIVSAWIITLPATVLLSAAFMGLIQHAVPGGCDIQQMQYPPPNSTEIYSTVEMRTA